MEYEALKHQSIAAEKLVVKQRNRTIPVRGTHNFCSNRLDPAKLKRTSRNPGIL